MKIPQIDFDEEKHVYRMDGVVYPSVTQIMKPLSMEKYSSIPVSVLQTAADRGTMVHSAIEDIIKYDFDGYPDEISGYMDGFLEFDKKYHPEYVESEMRLYHKSMMYAGTLDLLCRIDGRLELVDFKTTSVLNDDLCRVQLEAYRQMLLSHDIEVQGKRALHLKNGSWEDRIYENEDAVAWTTFCALRVVYNYINLSKSK